MKKIQPVSPFENVLVNSGNARVLAACVLSSPVSLEALLADLMFVCEQLPRFRSVVKRLSLIHI